MREAFGEMHEPACTVLVGHRDQDMFGLIELKLRAEGFEVVRARDGTEAFALALELKPRLLLLDVQVDGLHAHEVCRRLRADWRFANTGIVLLGSPDLPRRATAGLALGADDYIVQPFDATELVARVTSTLRRIDEMRSASPLTGLPGNVQIERELLRRCSARERLALVYVDLDHFKAFNDHYGFLRGDQVIVALGEILRNAAEKHPGTFLGHVGGDDFILLAEPSRVRHLLREVMASFPIRVRDLYDPRDAARGWIELEDRQGKRHRYGLLTLSIGVATNLGHRVDDHRRLVDIATEMKQYAKRRLGNVVAVDRRSGRTLGNLGGELSGSEPEKAKKKDLVGLPAPRGRVHVANIRIARRRSFGRHSIATLMLRMLVSAALVLVPLLLLAGPVVAENAQPGELLWPVKLRVESLRLALEQDPDSDVALHLEFASRRIAELVPLVGRDSDGNLIAAVTGSLQAHLARTRQLVESIEVGSPSKARGIRALVGSILVQQAQGLSVLLARCREEPGAAACQGAVRALSNVSRTLRAVSPEMLDQAGVQQPGVGSGQDEDTTGRDRDARGAGRGQDGKDGGQGGGQGQGDGGQDGGQGQGQGQEGAPGQGGGQGGGGQGGGQGQGQGGGGGQGGGQGQGQGGGGGQGGGQG